MSAALPTSFVAARQHVSCALLPPPPLLPAPVAPVPLVAALERLLYLLPPVLERMQLVTPAEALLFTPVVDDTVTTGCMLVGWHAQAYLLLARACKPLLPAAHRLTLWLLPGGCCQHFTHSVAASGESSHLKSWSKLVPSVPSLRRAAAVMREASGPPSGWFMLRSCTTQSSRAQQQQPQRGEISCAWPQPHGGML